VAFLAAFLAGDFLAAFLAGNFLAIVFFTAAFFAGAAAAGAAAAAEAAAFLAGAAFLVAVAFLAGIVARYAVGVTRVHNCSEGLIPWISVCSSGVIILGFILTFLHHGHGMKNVRAWVRKKLA